MGLHIEVSETAIATFGDIQEQIRGRLGNKAAKDFEKNMIRTFETLSNSPYMFKETAGDPNIRKGLIKKASSFFYKVTEHQIEILFFWDNRQEPVF
ncbi:type II toxin-antitoxin system RelE/ParE family toxin [Pedobacter faecalis]|uniref:type II toxin-antitoxin system RelE/ParE family toxin n=1 Tax=Pedobacter faecalis TaxID=3041495 RepID=UPI002550A602|nr:hypothetical protein [Pedobacter sp. ELA7]